MERSLEEQVKAQIEANDKLQQDNALLREMVARKDETMEQLRRDIEAKTAIIDRSSKTESTSRESDNHLRDRELAILQRRNGRLRKRLRAKQQTVSDLLKLVGKVTAQQGAESSAVEDAGEDDDDEDDDVEEVPQQPRRAAASGRSPTAVQQAAAAAGPAAQDDDVVDSSSCPEASETIRTLQAHLPRVLQDLGLSASRGSSIAQSPQHGSGVPRTPAPSPAAPTPSHKPSGLASETLAAAAAALRSRGAASSPAHSQPDAKARELRQGSLRALQALDSELEALEEKKRAVEELAKEASAASGVNQAAASTDELEQRVGQLERSLGIRPPESQASPAASPQHAVPRTPVSSPVAGVAPGEQSGGAGPVSLASAVSLAAAAAAAKGSPEPAPPSRGKGGVRPGTARALRALGRERQALEDKKKEVERLSKLLEPPSDDDDDDSNDGFPLR